MSANQGRIVRADVSDPQGHNRKCRPVVLISVTDDTPEARRYLAVALTTRFTQPPSNVEVPIPWNRDPTKVRTRLTKPCVAKCSWLVEIAESDIQSYAGVVPPQELILILEKVSKLQSSPGD